MINPNSVTAYHDEIKGKKEDSQAKIIYLAMLQYSKPMTMRMVQAYLEKRGFELEVNVMSRSMTNLKKGKGGFKIYFVYDDKCEETGRTAGFFSTDKSLQNQDYQAGQQLTI